MGGRKKGSFEITNNGLVGSAKTNARVLLLLSHAMPIYPTYTQDVICASSCPSNLYITKITSFNGASIYVLNLNQNYLKNISILMMLNKYHLIHHEIYFYIINIDIFVKKND